jgi:uncharacterized protein YcbX
MTTAGDSVLGTLARIWRYPVKSLRGEALDAVDVGIEGLEGDRRRALIVTSPEHARSGKPYRGKEHNLLHTRGDVAAARALATERGIDTEARVGGPFFDDQPVSVLLDCWLRELEGLVGVTLDPVRFRPNLFVETTRPCCAEESLVGAAFAVGHAVLRVVSPIERCVTPTYDPSSGVANPAILRALAQHRDTLMGVYCRVERTGRVALLDPVRVTAPAGPPMPSPA